ncbi:exosome nuclease subunit [Cryptotrichosporon argae]
MQPDTPDSSFVPVPTTSFPEFLAHMTTLLDSATSAAGALPDRSDLSFHRSLDRSFAKSLDKTSGRVLKLADQLLGLAFEAEQNEKEKNGKQSAKVKGKQRQRLEDEDDVLDRYRGAIDVVDGLLEHADSQLDEVNGAKKKAAIDVKASAVAQAGKKLPGPFASNSSYLPRHLLLDEQMAKPQLSFKEQIDTSNSRPLWRPTLPFKHHALVPADYTPRDDAVLFDDEVDVVPDKSDPKAREAYFAKKERRAAQKHHPYWYETKHLPYPTSMFVNLTPCEPKSFEETPFEFVDTPEALERMVAQLKEATEIAVDLEYHSTRSYDGLTCLIQISTREADWVVDALKLKSELKEGKLGGVLADPSIVKVFHGASSDITWLQQGFDIYVVNLFDTYEATHVLSFPQHSLQSLLKLYCGFDADKRYQKADWRIRPLPQEMLFYARSDTHFLLFIYDSLRNALLLKSRSPSPVGSSEAARKNPQAAMRQVLQLSAETALKLYVQEPYDVETGKGERGWVNTGKRWFSKKGNFDSEGGWAFKRLHQWRDQVAREEDESPAYIIPPADLAKLADLRDANMTMAYGILARTPVAKRAPEVVALLRAARADYAAHAAETAPAVAPAPASEPSIPQGEKKSAPVVDAWAAVGRQPVQATSSLFGKTVANQPKAKLVSAMFGQTLEVGLARKGRRGSPGFDAVRAAVHDDIVPKPVQVNEAPADAVDAPGVHKPEPETVAFVPSKSKAKAKAKEPPAAQSAPPSPPAVKAEASQTQLAKKLVPDADGIVSVKKKSKKKASASAVASAAAGAPAETARGKADEALAKRVKKEKKDKIRPEDIPAFDYAAEGNVLDQTQVERAPPKKKAKKARKTVVDMSGGFGKAPSDPSQPKAGNKSGTYI